MAWIPPVVTGAIAASVQPPGSFAWGNNNETNVWLADEGLTNDETNITWTDVVDSVVFSEASTNLAPLNGTASGHPFLECVGSSSRALTSDAITAFDDHEVILLLNFPSLPSNGSYFDGHLTNRARLYSPSAGRVGLFADSGQTNINDAASTPSTNTWLIVYFRVDTDNSFLSISGTLNFQDYTQPDPITNTEGYTVGANGGLTTYSDLKVAAVIANNSNTRFSMANISNITTELISRFSGLSATWDHTTFVAAQ